MPAHAALDRDIAALRANAQRWARLPAADKHELLGRVTSSVSAAAERWVGLCARAKGLAGTSFQGEEWIAGPWAVLYAIERYRRTLARIDRFGEPSVDPRALHLRPDGTLTATVFPATGYDRLLLAGVSAEVWMQDGVTLQNVQSTIGAFYRETAPPGIVTLVLGAGNVSSIGPLDVLTKMIVEGSVCILKMSPVNEYLAPVFSTAFAPFIDEGWLRIATGDAAVGRYLCAHKEVDRIHVTGRAQTLTNISADMRASARVKPITGELGNVTPTIVVPGPWTDAELRFQAEHILTQKLHNGGFNCIAAQVLVLPEEWAGSRRLLEKIEALAASERFERPAYYPGASERMRFIQRGNAVIDGAASLVFPHDSREDEVFGTEAFCSALVVHVLPGDIESYVERAVTFANERLYGTLGANLIVDPESDDEHAEILDRAIADLRYGCVAVNAWAGVGYFLTETPWGAYGGKATVAGSGSGTVHNATLFSRSLKSVVRAPFRPWPRPPWFVTNAKAEQISRALCTFEAEPSPLNATRVATQALFG
jgi:aldehyde dehydrogenase (NAD(P)+)